MKLFKLLVMLLAVTLSTVTHADQTLTEVIGDIYSRGELDGQSVFFVLGMDEAKEIAKESFSDITTVEELKEIGIGLADDLEDTGRLIFNNGEGDIVAAAKNGYEFAGDAAEFILTGPRDTLRKLPGAFQIQMHNARAGYYESDNEIVGGFKYAGHATWILVKGSYYLLVEAPAKAVIGAVGATLGVPAALAYQGGYIATKLVISFGKVTLNIGFEAIKTTFNVMIGVSTLAYSVASATTVAVVTTTLALPVYAYQAVKYLRPRVTIGRTKLALTNNEDDRKKAIEIAVETLKQMAVKLDFKASETVIKTKKRLLGYAVSLVNKGRNVLKITLRVKKSAIVLTGRFQYKKYKQLKKQDISKDDLKEMFQDALAI